MGFLKDRKVKKFAKAVEERQNTIFVFGSSALTKQFLEDLIRLGYGNKVALIAEEEHGWIEDFEEEISILVEKDLKKYQGEKLYHLIGFATAEKIIILHENSKLVQDIIDHIQDLSSSKVNIIMVAQHAPPFVRYLSQSQRDRFTITENVHSISSELYKLMELPLEQPPVITVPVPSGLVGSRGTEVMLEKSHILRVQRKGGKGEDELLPPENELQMGDLLMVYLLEGEQSIKEISNVFENFTPNGEKP